MTSDLRTRRFGILGGARSGLAVAALLKARGARVFLSDWAPAEKMRTAEEELRRLDIPFEFGQNSSRVLEADTLVISPGVPSDVPVVMEARAKGIAVVSELEVASWFCPSPIVAVTGTNGKTTTTALTGRMFSDARVPIVIAGNIGTAFSQVVGAATADGAAILEVSSFQLDHIQKFRPKVAAILNITPDHLDRYGNSFERYSASKRRIFENQAKDDSLIYNADDGITRHAVENHVSPEVTLLPFSTRRQLERGAFVSEGYLTTIVAGKRQELVPTDSISIRGEHNLANAMAATLAALSMQVPAGSVRATLKNFKGVEHRLEFVREFNGVTYVNDSKATNVDSVWHALQSFSKPLIVLIGGRDKGNDYSTLMSAAREHVKAVVAIGESADKVAAAFSPVTRTTSAGTMQEAVEKARELASPGDAILLSPACASFDWFDNYEHRGRVFKEIVLHLSVSG